MLFHGYDIESPTEKLREYIYYAMVIDAITAYVLFIMYPPKPDKTVDEDNNNKEKEGETQQYSPEQKKIILQKLLRVKWSSMTLHQSLVQKVS